jgi:Ca2+-binding RTX toxin-like protein
VDGVLAVGTFEIDLQGITHVIFEGAGGNDFMRLNPKLSWAATMDGGAGDDALLGGAAADDLRGGNGDDELAGHGGNDGLDGGFGGDTLIGYAGRDQVDYSTRTGNLNIRLDDGGSGDGESGENDFILPDVERILGGSGNDTMIGGPEVNLFYAGDGADRLVGGGGADRLFGEAGNDRLNGGDGDDYLEAGAGQDTLHGDAGADALFGLGGNDRLFSAGDTTADTVRGGAGFDLAHFDELDDVLATEAEI